MRTEVTIIDAGPDTSFGCRCDGEKIELTVAHEDLFIAQTVSPVAVAVLIRRLSDALAQMLPK